MFFLSCVCYAYVRVCLYVPCGHLLRKGWPLGSCLWCLLWVCHFPIGILGQVWYFSVSIPDLCTLTYFVAVQTCLSMTWTRCYKTWVHSQTQNKAQWLAACGHVFAISQSLHFILSLRLYSRFITSRPGVKPWRQVFSWWDPIVLCCRLSYNAGTSVL